MPPSQEAAVALGRRAWDAFRKSTLTTTTSSFRSVPSDGVVTNIAQNVANANARFISFATVHAVDYHQAHHYNNTHHTQRATAQCCSFSSVSSSSSHTDNNNGDGESTNKSMFSKLWDKYSFEGQRKRIILGERLFRSAQYRANDPRWFTEGRIPYEFRPRHALLTMHVWFLHKRLLADRVDSHLALLVQEELFDILWNDTRARIRAEGVNELTVNKHLKDAQQLTFLQCTHYDHAFQEFATDDKKRFEELAGVNWMYVLNKDEEAHNDQVKRLTLYVEYQYVNLLQGVPDDYFWNGKIPWGDIPEFATMKDNDGKELEEMDSVPGLEMLPEPWVKTLTDAGVTYYWNTRTNETSWKKPLRWIRQVVLSIMAIVATQMKSTFLMSLLLAIALERKVATSFQLPHIRRLARHAASRSYASYYASSVLHAQQQGGGGKGSKGGGAGGGDSKNPKPPKNIYADTIVLPQTDFSQRANALQREPELQNYWSSTNLYSKLSAAAASHSAERFVLHDGPPYANGDLHIGHALNKLLKDFINRHQILKGKQVHYVPGWDCHGLPIELKVLQTMKSEERQALTPITLREKAAAYAKEAVEKQSKSFQRYGVIGDFDNPYLTLLPEYEAAQIRVFGEMYKQGYIFRGRKPVHWSPSSRTALAEAELEYPEGHVSKSIYVALDVVSPSEELKAFVTEGDKLKVAIWTTTPWTIPANLAVAINPDLEYCVVDAHASVLDGKSKLLVGKELVDTLESKFELPEGEKLKILATFPGSSLVGTIYQHPLYERTSPVIAGGDYITTDSGTGLVHTAPGHGQEDYLTGLKNGLELLSPVDDEGKFTVDAGSSTVVGDDFVGKSVLGEGNLAVIEALERVGALIRAQDYGHKYPYDWRTKKPTIFRATDQWFASVEGFREDALKAVDSVQWIPDVGKNRINSFIESRGDWCISRQRSWGVPIPVFYDKETGGTVVLLNEDTLNHIGSIFAEHGSDAWWKMDVVDLLPEKYKCESDKWIRGTDTMDVWFDSGSSWAGVVKERAEKEMGLSFPADIYLEGSDQHRGWFQSSLLTSVAANRGQAPYKAVLTHGFVLDEKGFKMSKSLGNVVNPLSVIEGGNNKKEEPAYGADVLRLWVASVDYAGDVRVGSNIIKQTFESYRKLRNTARYLIGNLADFDPEKDAVPYEDLPSMDKWMLGTMSKVLNEVDDAFSTYQFSRVSNELLRFATADLSNFYLDVAKDRLYISAVNDARRRSCQTVLHALLVGFAKAVAPILPHMAEDIWQNLPFKNSGDDSSVFEGGYSKELMSYPAFDTEKWNLVRDVRTDVNQVLEVARQDKLVGASLDAGVYIYTTDEDIRKVLAGLDGDESLITPSVKTNGVDELRTALMISQVRIVESEDEVTSSCDATYITKGELSGCIIGVKKAEGTKCGRCWFYDKEVGKHARYGADLCQRCDTAIFSWEEKSGSKFTAHSLVKAPVA